MTALAIIADDLTGALDAAAPFAARGLSTVVALSPERLAQTLATGAKVIGVSTDSREIDADAAHLRVRRAVERIPRDTALFKKVDSRLKGNIEAELDAIPFETALVIPAIPAFDRWVKNGKLGGFGVDTPIDIAERLGAHAATAIVPDVSSLNEIEAALDANSGALPVGARALAEVMAYRMGEGSPAPLPSARARKMIIVAGSRDPITLAQVEHLLRARPDTDHIEAPSGLASRPIDKSRDVTILRATDMGIPADPASVARRLAHALKQAGPLEGTLLVLSGGATAQAVLTQLGAGMIELLGEALPGLPIAQTDGFKLITKSGGFGEPNVLLTIVNNAMQAGS